MNGKMMSFSIILLMVISSFGVVGTNYSVGDDRTLLDAGEYVPGEVIVGFNSQIDVKDIMEFEGHSINDKIEELNIAVVEVEIGGEQAFINSVSSSPFVEYVELNKKVHMCYIPNDERYEQQRDNLELIKCDKAWDDDIARQGRDDVNNCLRIKLTIKVSNNRQLSKLIIIKLFDDFSILRNLVSNFLVYLIR